MNHQAIIKYFDGLSFEESTHKYTFKNKQLSRSVSDLVKLFVKKAHFDKIAEYKDIQLGLPIGTHSTMWKKNANLSCVKGDKAHFFGEMYAFCRKLKPTDGFERAIVKFYKELPEHIEVIFVELKMYHKKLMFGGMGDIILYNKKKKAYIIADYKSNANLFKVYKDNKLKKPFSELAENNFNKYQIQLNFYQILFEQTGFKVCNRIIVWIKEDGTYSLHKVKDYTKRLKEYMKI